MMKFSGKMENIGRTLSTAITLPILGMGAAALKAAADYEQLEVSFQTLLKSAEKGSKFFEDLKKFSAATPFEMTEVAAAAKVMLGYGFSADETNRQLQILGDVAAATGGDIEGLSVIMGQGAALGKFMTVDLKQLAMRGIPILEALSKQLGVSAAEVMELASTSQISYPMVSKAIEDMAKEGGPYFNAMQNQSKTLGGLFSTLKDTAVASFAEVGMSIKETFKLDEVIVKFTEKIQKAVEWFKALSDEQRKNIVVVAAVAAAIGPLLLGFATITKVVTTAVIGFKGLLGVLAFLTSPVGLIVAGIVALAAGLVYAYNKSERFRATINGVGAVLSEVVKIFSEAIGAFVRGFQQLSEGDFRKAAGSFQEALVKTNPVALAFTQGKRLAGAYTDAYEATIQKAADEKAFDPYKDKQKLLQEMSATGAAAGAAFSEGMAVGQGGGGETSMPGPSVQRVSPFDALKKDIPQVSSMLSGLNLQVSKVRDTVMQGANGIAMFMDNLGTGIQGFADMFGEAIGMLNETVQMFFANQAAAIDANYERQRAAIEGSRMSEEAKAKAIQTLDETTDKKKKALMRKQAVREKLMALFQAAINTAGAIINALKTDPTGILAAIVGGISAVQIGLIAGAKLPALAEGGLAYGPSMAMVGDNPNARINPEVIAPLDKLKGMMNGGNGTQRVIVEGRISGKDILLSSERAGNDRIRTRGY
ncbi:MAG: hypothetical protein IPJ00_17465 [Saprospirales bacterium]|nr:hypothetical protein [Saprospirales bacterium]